MAMIRHTEYICDKCGKTQDKRGDLKRFYVRDHAWDEVFFDLCRECELGLVVTLAEYLPDGQDPNAIAREPKKEAA